MPSCRTQQRYTGATCLRAAGHDGDHEFPTTPPPKQRKRVYRADPVFRLASMLAAILDEEGDDPYRPSEIRLQQARELRDMWSSTSILGVVYEILNLKRGYCVRCSGDPCPECGADSTKLKDAWTL